MQLLSWFKVAALLLSAVVSTALAMLAVGSGLRRLANASFATSRRRARSPGPEASPA